MNWNREIVLATPTLTRVCFVLAASAFVLGLGSCADKATGPRELTFGHVGEPGSLFALSAEEFARRANERLDGFEVVVYGSSQLGSDELLLQKIKLGTVDFALPSTVMSSQIDEFGLFEMPYLVRDRAHMRAIEKEVVWPDLAPLAEQKGYRIIALWENGFRHVTNNTRPIASPDDLSGIKLRTPRGIWRVKLFQTLGANPTPMALSEVFIGLQTGVIDGQENPLAQIWGSKLYEVQEHLSLTGHVYTPGYVVVSASHWAALPPDVRRVLEEEARLVQTFVHDTAARLDHELLAQVEAEGVKVTRPDRDAFLLASSDIYDEFDQAVEGGGLLVERAVAAGSN
ncbi:MAG: TRAP transporter substrate-binding protein [bacterium]|jgi:tripartite ATP-independent transporter DctP family solute receptor|nr:TRAP transporter substrate-binding protein [Gemmatimonadota bacterium]HIL89670.1 TRAP transporter substrate-binding protein [Gemmatimonadota bacterium]